MLQDTLSLETLKQVDVKESEMLLRLDTRANIFIQCQQQNKKR